MQFATRRVTVALVLRGEGSTVHTKGKRETGGGGRKGRERRKKGGNTKERQR
jgi:hypothetical protein